MFELVEISDLIQISPEDFEKPSIRAIEDNINAKYADKVIQGVGLCMGLYNVLDSSEGLIGNGTGIVNVNVTFRLLVFRPFKGEILEGTIVEHSDKGIRLSVEFFQEIWVPGPAMLFENSQFNREEDAWMWVTDGGAEMFFDKGEVVRFRVESEEWNDHIPQKPMNDPNAAPPPDPPPPYAIIASMSMGALGPLCWWEEEEGVDGAV